MKRNLKWIISLVLVLITVLTVAGCEKPKTDKSGWVTEDGITRYQDADGNFLYRWQEIAGNTYYFLPDTGEMVTGWKQIGNNRYYFDENGARVSGWLRRDGSAWYLDAEGRPYSGWLDWEGKRYCFGSDGKMLTGWYTEGENRYYFLETGAMAVGEVKIDGVSSFFTSTGKYCLLTNSWHKIPDNYTWERAEFEGFQFEASGRDSLAAFVQACRREGYTCYIDNTYRSRATQQWMWDNSVSTKMAAGMTYEEAVVEAGKTLAKPGHSEHETGLAVDILGTEGMYTWMAEHCYDYGFVLRYPDNRYEITGITYEPWHLRYVGIELAQELKGKDLSLEEYFAALTQ